MLQKFRGLIVVLIVIALDVSLYNSQLLKELDYKMYDLIMQVVQKFERKDNSFYTVVIDIDEKSLDVLGQWPLPRVIEAELINRLQEMNPSALGLNILFAEEDRSSPLYIKKFYKHYFDVNVQFRDMPEGLQDNDKLLHEAILNAHATLSTYFSGTEEGTSFCNSLSYRKNYFSNTVPKFRAKSLICNQEKIQKGVENFGFINAQRDEDGVLRRMPFFMGYHNKIFPSFSLATVLSFDPTFQFSTNESNLMLKFSISSPKHYSAIDVLEGRVSKKKIEGKIVIIGSSAVGITTFHKTPLGENISNNMLHAFAIENLLNHSFLQQPKSYQQFNILLSFLLSLVMIVLLTRREYFLTIALLTMVMVVTLIWMFYSYFLGTYISIVYLWIPFPIFSLLYLIYHIIHLNEEKQEREKFLIRQSKFATMGEMIALIAHQWRQPLSAINGIVLNIDIDHRKEQLEREKLEKHLDDIEETTAYLSRTINDFTDFFSHDKVKKKFSINEVIEHVKRLVVLKKEDNIVIVYDKSENLTLEGYRSELVQSLLILLNNAVYACRKYLLENQRGHIRIEVSRIDTSFIFTIEDNGGGILPKNLKKIFDPYFTTKSKHNGTGLGLYILKLIVEESMRGKVSVTNGKEGAIFRLEIPAD
jgi:signal transduction histidine kinase